MDVAWTDVESFRTAVAREVGLRFGDDKLPFLAEVLASRLYTTGCRNVGVYLARIDASEQAELARALSVTETYFLRNRNQFRAFEEILRQREATPLRTLNLLSAGCSSGEEAYSLAITVRETLRNPDAWAVSIVGVDLNPDVLAKARAASYSKWALRDTPPAIVSAYFEATRDRFLLCERVRGMVKFERENLLRAAKRWRDRSFDVVFCRNVLMYLAPEAARALVAAIARALTPGGHLFLGHAENLRGISEAFHLCHAQGTFFYQRKDGPLPLVAQPDVGSWLESISWASERIEALAEPEPAPAPKPAIVVAPRRDLGPTLQLLEEERFHDALRLLEDAPDDPEALLLRAMLLLHTGDVTGAERTCEALLLVDDLHAGAHYLMAICREHDGDRDGAIEHSQAAAYLDADFAMPHLQLGRLARRSGDVDTARHELGVALGLLPREDAGRILLFGGGFGRDALMQLCRGELRACGGQR